MAKSADASVLDGGLNVIATATELYICEDPAPTTRAECITRSLVPVQTPAYTGPSAGASNSRQLQVDGINDITANGDGTATHVALCTASTLLELTSCNNVAITNGQQVDLLAYLRTNTQPV